MRAFALVVLAVAVIGLPAFLYLNKRPVHRTRNEVIAVLKQAMKTGGDSSWDDFVSIRIAEPELEAVRLKCLNVNLSSPSTFNETLQLCIAELSASQAE